MSAGYPKREAFFSHKFVRLVMRFCGAQEIGPEGSWLLTIIAHTEDARRYTGPVTFWNEQLISVMGLNSRKQLDRIRDRCIEAGWLHYERDSKRAVGKYWVKVPPNLDGMDDADISCDAGLWSKNDTRMSQECPISVPRMSQEVVHERHISVPPSTLSCPLPELNKPAAAEPSQTTTPKTDEEILVQASKLVADWKLPTGCEAPRFRGALSRWVAARYRQHGWFSEINWDNARLKYFHWTPEQWFEAITSAAVGGNKWLAEYAAQDAGKKLATPPKSKTKELTAP